MTMLPDSKPNFKPHADLCAFTYTTQKKFRISCAYFVVLSTSNLWRLWKNEHIKLKLSENIPYINISTFCENQFIPNGAT